MILRRVDRLQAGEAARFVDCGRRSFREAVEWNALFTAALRAARNAPAATDDERAALAALMRPDDMVEVAV